jgi:hypothetical protein
MIHSADLCVVKGMLLGWLSADSGRLFVTIPVQLAANGVPTTNAIFDSFLQASSPQAGSPQASSLPVSSLPTSSLPANQEFANLLSSLLDLGPGNDTPSLAVSTSGAPKKTIREDRKEGFRKEDDQNPPTTVSSNILLSNILLCVPVPVPQVEAPVDASMLNADSADKASNFISTAAGAKNSSAEDVSRAADNCQESPQFATTNDALAASQAAAGSSEPESLPNPTLKPEFVDAQPVPIRSDVSASAPKATEDAPKWTANSAADAIRNSNVTQPLDPKSVLQNRGWETPRTPSESVRPGASPADKANGSTNAPPRTESPVRRTVPVHHSQENVTTPVPTEGPKIADLPAIDSVVVAHSSDATRENTVQSTANAESSSVPPEIATVLSPAVADPTIENGSSPHGKGGQTPKTNGDAVAHDCDETDDSRDPASVAQPDSTRSMPTPVAADRMAAPTHDANRAPIPERNSPSPYSNPFPATGDVHDARLSTHSQKVEMRIGLHTTTFGDVQLHAVMRNNEHIGLAIESERGDLRGMLANEVPHIADKLNHSLKASASRNIDQNMSFNPGSGNGEDRPRFFQSPQVAIDEPSRSHEPTCIETNSETLATTSSTLNVCA